MRWRRPGTVLVSATAALAGLLFATSATTANGTDLRAGRRVQLSDLIDGARERVRAQEAEAGRLRDQVAALGEAAAARDQRVATQTARSDALVGAAGLQPVTGPALAVRLDDAPVSAAEGALPDDLVVHQQDVQAVVNALWAGGAEAMTLMDQRMISTSAVRCVGNTLVLQGRVYGPPFVVTAVGDQEAMRTALTREPGVAVFLRYVERFGLGYDVTALEDARLPAYDGPLELASVAPS